ncbi:hypothetical protein C8R47DRAFT_1145488 [Mycena vitilis]|nr:hypothetical protein C8R47DRAFT_1145488 [Mycena vitilis]
MARFAMADARSPLLVPELLDHCISFLRWSPSHLKSCALVSHLWVHGAQALLFREIFIRSRDSWLRLQVTFQSSPHLIRHIQSLTVSPIDFSDDALSATFNFAFANLRELFAYAIPPPSILLLQELVSQPNLTHITLHFGAAITRDFFSLWERCTRSLRHLELFLAPGSSPHYRSPTNRSLPSIPLESLRVITYDPVGDVGDWLSDPLGPFDLSNLRVLSISNENESWRDLPPTFRSITALEITAQESGMFDLSTLPNLEILRIGSYSGATTEMVMNSLSSAKHLRRLLLGIVSHLLAGCAGELDARLADVITDPLPTVELETDLGEYEEHVLHFPRLSARNLVCTALLILAFGHAILNGLPLDAPGRKTREILSLATRITWGC